MIGCLMHICQGHDTLLVLYQLGIFCLYMVHYIFKEIFVIFSMWNSSKGDCEGWSWMFRLRIVNVHEWRFGVLLFMEVVLCGCFRNYCLQFVAALCEWVRPRMFSNTHSYPSHDSICIWYWESLLSVIILCVEFDIPRGNDYFAMKRVFRSNTLIYITV